MKRTLLMLALATALTGCSDGPKMHAEVQGESLTLTADDDGVITVQKIVVNGRAGQDNCDSSTEKLSAEWAKVGVTLPLPARLQRGDSVSDVFSGCGQILSAEVTTDRGTLSLSFSD